MSGVPSAFILVLVEVLVMPEGVVMVLDLLVVALPFVVVDDLVMPAGLPIVLDFVVVAGVWDVRVVIFDELLLILVVAGVVGVAAGTCAKATEPPSRLKETRKLRMRFIKKSEMKGERMSLLRSCCPCGWLVM